MIEKKGILIVGGGLLQIAALEKAKEMGYYTFLTDMNKNCPALKYADEFIQLSTKDINEHISLAKELKKYDKIAAVYTQGCDVEYTVSMVANAIGLPGINPESALNCNDKIRMRTILNNSGVDYVKFGCAKSADEALKVVKDIGLPCVIKPADNSASRGLTKIYKEEETKNAFDSAISNCFLRKEAIIEELLIGNEFSIDTIIYNGKLYPAGISDRVFKNYHEYAVQIGSITPSLLPEQIQQDMYNLMNKAAQALGVDNGAFKGDIIIVNNKPKIIEVTARTSGGFDSQYRKPFSFGIDILKCTIDIAMGNEFDPYDLIPKWFKWSMTTSVFPNPGIVRKIRGINKLKKIKGVRKIFMDLKEGDKVEPYIHCARRVNNIIITANTYNELMNLEEQVQKTLIIETE